MKILVAGNRGMIGSNVERILSQQGHTVWGADLKDRFDLRIADHCKIVTIGAEQVVHLADRTVGIGYSSTHHGQMMTDSLLISLNLLEAARKAGVKDYLYVSSSCVYPDDNDLVVSLDEPITSLLYGDPPEKANQGYGWAKRMAELQCAYYAKEYGMRTIIARPANVYGPSYDWSRPVEDMHVIPSLIVKMLRGDKEIMVWGSGKQTRTFQYESETASRIVWLSEKGVSGEAYNLGGMEWSIEQMVDFCRKWTHWDGRIIFDTSKPEGPKRKTQNTLKLDALIGKREQYQGLAETVEAARKALH